MARNGVAEGRSRRRWVVAIGVWGGLLLSAEGMAGVASVPATGQKDPYDATRTTDEDGDLEKGVAWPSPRFSDRQDGTQLDKLTNLMWMQNAHCWGTMKWTDALDRVAAFNARTVTTCTSGTTPTAVYTDWRLPSRLEMESLLDMGVATQPPLPSDHTFDVGSVEAASYWTSTSDAADLSGDAWYVDLDTGAVGSDAKNRSYYFMLVRGR
ncbi:MAG: DUF1566 domain-containing protein [Magnetococcales bacterium]|nr:DUF1566 domain-containing protein [Magnetococcales bacterium]